MQTMNEQVVGWLDTFSVVRDMKENPEAMAREINTISAVFAREAATPAAIDQTFEHIKMTSASRAWPTAAQVYEALRTTKRKKNGEQIVSDKGGDRLQLDAMSLATLENQVIPTARRWLRIFPGLRHHAIKTLEYWGEPLTDDQGNSHERAAK